MQILLHCILLLLALHVAIGPGAGTCRLHVQTAPLLGRSMILSYRWEVTTLQNSHFAQSFPSQPEYCMCFGVKVSVFLEPFLGTCNRDGQKQRLPQVQRCHLWFA